MHSSLKGRLLADGLSEWGCIVRLHSKLRWPSDAVAWSPDSAKRAMRRALKAHALIGQVVADHVDDRIAEGDGCAPCTVSCGGLPQG